MQSIVIGIAGALLLGAALLFFGCASTGKCSAEAVAPLVPRIEAALAAHDSIALSELAVEVGAEVFVCAVHEHAKQAKAKPADAGSDGGVK